MEISMKKYAVVSLLFGVIVFAGCASKSGGSTNEVAMRSKATVDDAKSVQGMWRPITSAVGGQAMPDAIMNSISLKMDNGKYEVFVGQAPDRGTYTIAPSTKPKSMDVTGTEGPNVGRTFPAIYELKGDTLTICYDLSGAQRPTEFKSLAGTKLYLVSYVRK
jgi:uncharacterized protein (TIGR03067 family)